MEKIQNSSPKSPIFPPFSLQGKPEPPDADHAPQIAAPGEKTPKKTQKPQISPKIKTQTSFQSIETLWEFPNPVGFLGISKGFLGFFQDFMGIFLEFL